MEEARRGLDEEKAKLAQMRSSVHAARRAGLAELQKQRDELDEERRKLRILQANARAKAKARAAGAKKGEAKERPSHNRAAEEVRLCVRLGCAAPTRCSDVRGRDAVAHRMTYPNSPRRGVAPVFSSPNRHSKLPRPRRCCP